MQNLHRICAENALKLHTICASFAHIELKIGEKLPESCMQMFCGCDEKFFTVLFKKCSAVTVIQVTTEFFV